MAGRLLDRQSRLLEYLTSSGAIFQDKSDVPLDPSLHGIDRRMLDLEARFSHEKRMEKIVAVFDTTFELLGEGASDLVREFSEQCPPRDIGRIENARQFFEYLTARGKQTALPRPDILDVAACELACAEARLFTGVDVQAEPDTENSRHPSVRRRPGIVLLRAAFDIRKVFESGDGRIPAQRDTPLVISWISSELQILELPVEVFDLLTALEGWTTLDELPGADELIVDLTQYGILERRG